MLLSGVLKARNKQPLDTGAKAVGSATGVSDLCVCDLCLGGSGSQEPAPTQIARSILSPPGPHSRTLSGQSFHGLRFSTPPFHIQIQIFIYAILLNSPPQLRITRFPRPIPRAFTSLPAPFPFPGRSKAAEGASREPMGHGL